MQDLEDCEDGPGGGAKKWHCDYCTYHNWSTAAKCTMCRAQKPVSLLQGQDIYSLDRGPSPPPDHNNLFNLDALNLGKQQLPAPSEELLLKWSCPSCTYHNYSRAVRCTQCLSPRKKVSPALSRNSPGSPRSSPLPPSPPPAISSVNRANAMRSLADHLHPLHISVSSAGSTTCAESRSPTTISCKSTSNQPAKWNCLVCTYENWPRASLCVLCGVKRGGNTPADQLQTIAVRDSPSPEGASMRRVDVDPRRSSNRRLLPSTDNRQSSPASHNRFLPSDNRFPPSDNRHLPSDNRPTPSDNRQPPSDNRQLLTDNRQLLTENGGEMRENRLITAESSTVATGSQLQDNRQISARSETPVDRAESGSGSGSIAGAGAATPGSNNLEYEKRLRQMRRRMRETDWAWVSACMGVVEGDANPVEAYLNSGGDPTRKLTQSEATILARPGVFEPGHTLVHLALRFQREDLLATLLSQMEGLPNPAVKRVPSYVAPDLAAAIRRQLALSLRHRKGGFPCFYLSDCATYTLPPEIEDLPSNIQEQLYSELLDKDARTELEDELCINWSQEITRVLGSRLYPLWNRSAGDCLLDAALQATWGVFDRDNMLRRALADSLTEAGHVFYPRWKEWETRQAQELGFSLADSQWDADWADLLSLAGQPGSSLEQTHIFCLSHVLRRPIIVYGVKYVKSWRGENLGYAKFEGVYLPLLWDPGFCYRSPIALGYTRGHFCALVPPEPDLGCGGAGGGAAPPTPTPLCAYLPLVNREREVLPLHFTSRGEMGREEAILRQWMDVGITETGIMVAQQTITRPPLLVAQMTEEWLNYYRKIAQSTSAPLAGRNPLLSARITLESSDESSDND